MTRVTHVTKDLLVTEATQRQLDKVGVRREIFERVQEASEQTEAIVNVGVATVAASTSGVDALVDPFSNQSR
jgi:hypothetical protein